MAAANGSVDDIQEIMMGIACAPNSPEAILFLPVCWPNLDPARIPSARELDAMLSNSDTDNLPKGPFLALEMIHFLPTVPRQALVDLWPRVWPWIYFLDTYRDVIRTSPNYLDLYWFFFSYVHRLPAGLVGSSPGFRQFVAKAWSAFIATGNSKARGFRELLHFVDGDSGSICDAHVVEYTAGAGGSLDELARLICAHLNIDGRVAYIQSGIRFAMAFEPARASTGNPELGDFHHFLRRRGIVRRLTEILWDVMSDSSDLLTSNTRGELVTNCLSLLVLELCNPDGYLWLPQALRSGLLRCIARIANMCDSGVHISNLQKLLEYTERDGNFACRLPNPSVHADSPIYSQWMKFIALAEERLDTTDAFDDRECGPHRNYGEVKIQSLRRLLHGERLTGRNKSFMRALGQQTYHQNRNSIFRMQIAAMRSGLGEHVFITQDYITGIPVIGCQPFLAPDFVPRTDLEVQQVYHGARARRDHRIQLHLVSFPGQPSRIFIMRSSNAAVHDRLVYIAGATREDDRMEKELAALDGLCDISIPDYLIFLEFKYRSHDKRAIIMLKSRCRVNSDVRSPTLGNKTAHSEAKFPAILLKMAGNRMFPINSYRAWKAAAPDILKGAALDLKSSPSLGTVTPTNVTIGIAGSGRAIADNTAASDVRGEGRDTGFITRGRMLHATENQQVSGLKMAAWVDVPHRPSKIASMVKEKRMRVSCRVMSCCIAEFVQSRYPPSVNRDDREFPHPRRDGLSKKASFITLSDPRDGKQRRAHEKEDRIGGFKEEQAQK
ncbi:hypothetical protein B0H13DRAFT_2565920 [Mycena leptocephala]|nr:hypothetical protein B0H13DRAFT_2565920 [Mycena leptocephala]